MPLPGIPGCQERFSSPTQVAPLLFLETTLDAASRGFSEISTIAGKHVVLPASLTEVGVLSSDGFWRAEGATVAA